jgi:hypothetical protein
VWKESVFLVKEVIWYSLSINELELESNNKHASKDLVVLA